MRFTLGELAKLVHLAPQYLCAVFKKHTGYTLMEYVTDRRIDYAKRLIPSGHGPLSVIADRCGFSDYYSFSHAFKAKEGISAS